MRVTVDTSHDSHDDIKKVIKMLQHLVGDSQEVFTNQPQETASPIANIFGDAGATAETASASSETSQETQIEAKSEESTESTEDLFAELFSEEELKKMDKVEIKEEEETKPAKGKKYGIELY